MLFNKSNKELQTGSVISYKSKKMLVWNINKAGKIQLITAEGKKFTVTLYVKPEIEVIGNYPKVQFNNVEYIITDNNNIYSTASGKKVYEKNSNNIRLNIFSQLN
jgi:hypothetical protein